MASDAEIVNMAIEAFHIRDIHGGLGQRDRFYEMMWEMAEECPGIEVGLLELVPRYGSWLDMFAMAAKYPDLKPTIFKLAYNQIIADEHNLVENRPISLLGKWAPREGKAHGQLAIEFARFLVHVENPDLQHSQVMSIYRRRISRLNAALKTVEVLECANRWDEIDPAKVPQKALQKKKNAYLNQLNSGQPRKPDDVKRERCRLRFQGYISSQNSDTAHMSNYGPVRDSVIRWIHGGWRGI
jgi:hypothetical protein